MFFMMMQTPKYTSSLEEVVYFGTYNDESDL